MSQLMEDRFLKGGDMSPEQLRQVLNLVVVAIRGGVEAPVAVLLGRRFPGAALIHLGLAGDIMRLPPKSTEKGEHAAVLVKPRAWVAHVLRAVGGRLVEAVVSDLTAAPVGHAVHILYLLGREVELLEFVGHQPLAQSRGPVKDASSCASPGEMSEHSLICYLAMFMTVGTGAVELPDLRMPSRLVRTEVCDYVRLLLALYFLDRPGLVREAIRRVRSVCGRRAKSVEQMIREDPELAPLAAALGLNSP
jgi:hypothetical protein